MSDQEFWKWTIIAMLVIPIALGALWLYITRDKRPFVPYEEHNRHRITPDFRAPRDYK